VPVDRGYGMGVHWAGRRFELWLGKRGVIAVRLMTVVEQRKGWIDDGREILICCPKSVEVRRSAPYAHQPLTPLGPALRTQPPGPICPPGCVASRQQMLFQQGYSGKIRNRSVTARALGLTTWKVGAIGSLLCVAHRCGLIDLLRPIRPR
jgi:hypothetical protein